VISRFRNVRPTNGDSGRRRSRYSRPES
jgi:hypothetical protein